MQSPSSRPAPGRRCSSPRSRSRSSRSSGLARRRRCPSPLEKCAHHVHSERVRREETKDKASQARRRLIAAAGAKIHLYRGWAAALLVIGALTALSSVGYGGLRVSAEYNYGYGYGYEYNSPPSCTAPSDQTANEGASTSFSLGSFSDVDGNGPWQVDVTWG